MSDWRPLLLHGYYYASYPWRVEAARRRGIAGRAPTIVLFYHRVADDHANPWTASTRAFARQIRWLKRTFDLVTLAEAQRRIQSGFQTRPAVAITFDDGYADNCRFALPLLLEQKVPFTYFVTTRNVMTGKPFEHDVDLGCPLAPNTVEQIRDLARAGVEIGAHTRTHPNLGAIADVDRLYDEVVGGRDELEQLAATNVRYFAFPFGRHANLNQRVFQIAREAGLAGVCSAYGGFNFPGDDPFHLQRVPTDEHLIRLKNWVTLDPRKLNAVRRFQEQLPHGAGLTRDASEALEVAGA
jgi:peptidoglycan/xylan/chitin deacetylase (PgdA/CDA1 family)